MRRREGNEINACERLFEMAKVVEMHLTQDKHNKED